MPVLPGAEPWTHYGPGDAGMLLSDLHATTISGDGAPSRPTGSVGTNRRIHSERVEEAA
ncbi:hypothetical protein [Parasphingorhabdus pacifica]